MRRLAEQVRRRAGAVVIDSFFRGLSSAGRLHPRSRPERHNVEVIRDVPYRVSSDLIEHRLDIYRSTALRPPFPIVLYVHGGGFRILSKDTHWLMGLLFARRGYLAFNISYRLAPKNPYPCAVEDVFAAYEWVLEHAKEYGGDPTSVVLAGESAGANLVTGLALASCYRREEPHAKRIFELGVVPRAVVPACGMLQVSDPERFIRTDKKMMRFLYDRIVEVSEAYLSGCSAMSRELLDFADPLLMLERGERPDRPLPPFFAPCGASDPVLEDTRRLKAALDRLGAHCEAPEYEGEHHAFHALIWRKPAIKCWRETFAFLERYV